MTYDIGRAQARMTAVVIRAQAIAIDAAGRPDLAEECHKLASKISDAFSDLHSSENGGNDVTARVRLTNDELRIIIRALWTYTDSKDGEYDNDDVLSDKLRDRLRPIRHRLSMRRDGLR